MTSRVADSMAESSSDPNRVVELATQEHVGGGVHVVGERQGLVDRLDAVGLGVRGFVMCATSPLTRISPLSGGCAPDRAFMSVDLPAPLPPTRPTTSPA